MQEPRRGVCGKCRGRKVVKTRSGRKARCPACGGSGKGYNTKG